MDKGVCIHTSAQGEVDILEDPFLLAAAGGHEQILRLVVKYGPNPRKCTADQGNTALHLLLWHWGELGAPLVDSLIALLLRIGLKLEAGIKDEQTLLLDSARWGHKAEAKLLLELGADIGAFDVYGEGVLHKAAFSDKQLLVIELFISKGASVEAKSHTGKSPLIISAQYG